MREQQDRPAQTSNARLRWGGAVLIAGLACVLSVTACRAKEGSDPIAFVRAIERAKPDYVKRNAEGLVVDLRLSYSLCNGSNLATVARIEGLKSLTLQCGPLDVAGIRSLAANRTLSSLDFQCFSYYSNGLPAGVLFAATELPNIRRLALIGSDAPESEYTALAGMSNLTELVIAYSKNFTDAHFNSLTNAPALRSVTIISNDKLSRQVANSLSQFPQLTNAVLHVKGWHTNWQPNAKSIEPGGVK